MKAELAILRAYGRPIVRLLVAVEGGMAYIASDEQYARQAQGLPALDPVGFPLDDVFQYDARLE